MEQSVLIAVGTDVSFAGPSNAFSVTLAPLAGSVVRPFKRDKADPERDAEAFE
jgi:hypothetical protein